MLVWLRRQAGLIPSFIVIIFPHHRPPMSPHCCLIIATFGKYIATVYKSLACIQSISSSFISAFLFLCIQTLSRTFQRLSWDFLQMNKLSLGKGRNLPPSQESGRAGLFLVRRLAFSSCSPKLALGDRILEPLGSGLRDQLVTEKDSHGSPAVSSSSLILNQRHRPLPISNQPLETMI